MSRISTLNEKPLHEALKQWYAQPGDLFEAPVAGFVVDIVRGNLLIEIQTRNFSAIKRKLERLIVDHPTRLVYPIPHEKWIVKLAADGNSPVSRRKSPKRGVFEHVFDELVRMPALLLHPNFSIELVLIEEEEVRRYDGVRGWRRGGWVTDERRLLRVLERRILSEPLTPVCFSAGHAGGAIFGERPCHSAGNPEKTGPKNGVLPAVNRLPGGRGQTGQRHSVSATEHLT